MTPLPHDSSRARLAGAQSPKQTRIRVDWTRGARLLGRGERPEAVAAALGIDEERLWRHLKASPRFRRLVGETLDLCRFSPGLWASRQAGPEPE